MQFDDKRKDISSRLRSIYDYTMGVLWTALGIFVLFHQKWGYDLKLDDAMRYILGIASTLYGLFRFYRGIKNK